MSSGAAPPQAGIRPPTDVKKLWQLAAKLDGRLSLNKWAIKHLTAAAKESIAKAVAEGRLVVAEDADGAGPS